MRKRCGGCWRFCWTTHKSTPAPGGETQVTLHRRGRNHCALTVANQGEPIPPEARRQIFQRFYRADPARSRNGSFGLGLSIAEGIVAQHHGTIDVTCAGGFNRFRAELPANRSSGAGVSPRPGNQRMKSEIQEACV